MVRQVRAPKELKVKRTARAHKLKRGVRTVQLKSKLTKPKKYWMLIMRLVLLLKLKMMNQRVTLYCYRQHKRKCLHFLK